MVRPDGMPILRPTPSWSVFDRRMVRMKEGLGLMLSRSLLSSDAAHGRSNQRRADWVE